MTIFGNNVIQLANLYFKYFTLIKHRYTYTRYCNLQLLMYKQFFYNSARFIGYKPLEKTANAQNFKILIFQIQLKPTSFLCSRLSILWTPMDRSSVLMNNNINFKTTAGRMVNTMLNQTIYSI